jgi:ABC-type bacteriocin/lantibiotic exporter with double-glycine peptidase domain
MTQIVETNLLKMVYQLWSLLTLRRRMQLGFLLALMILTAVLEIVSIGSILPFLGALIKPEGLFDIEIIRRISHFFGLTHPNQLLIPFACVFAIAAIIAGLAKITLLKVQIKISYGIGIDLSLNIFKRTLYQNYSTHIKRHSSEIISAVYEKANLVTGGFIVPILTTISSLLTLIAIVTVLLALAPYVTIITFLAFGSVYGVIAYITKKRLFNDGIQINHRKNQLIKILQESFGGIRDILIDGTQEVFCEVYRQAIIPLRRAESSVSVFSAAPRYVIEFISMVLMVGICLYMVTRPEQSLEAIPVLGTFALAAQRLLPLLHSCYSNWTYIHSTRPVLSDTLALSGQVIPQWADRPVPAPLRFENLLVLKDLSFRHGNATPLVLDGINLSIKRGGRIGLIGATGSGKSTLLDVIMGLLNPSHGGLIVDDELITEENNRAWQRRLAHVPQTIFLVDATILENIAFGVPRNQIDLDRAKMAAQMAQIAETIACLPKGYDTRVGEHGVRLSGGQRQRLGIARALYKKADVLILDEATSALDSETEAAVMLAIENLPIDLTIIIVAHRVTTLKNCTEIIELDQGRIKIKGSYADLIEHNIN